MGLPPPQRIRGNMMSLDLNGSVLVGNQTYHAVYVSHVLFSHNLLPAIYKQFNVTENRSLGQFKTLALCRVCGWVVCLHLLEHEPTMVTWN